LGPLIGGIFASIDFWRGAFWFFAIQAAGLTLWILFSLTPVNKTLKKQRSIFLVSGY